MLFASHPFFSRPVSLSSSPPSPAQSSVLVGHSSSFTGFSSALHNAPHSSDSWPPWSFVSLRTWLHCHPLCSAGYGLLANWAAIRCCSTDGVAGIESFISGCVSTSSPCAGVGVPSVSLNLSFSASIGGLAPIESMMHADVRESYLNREISCSMAQMPNDANEAPQLPEELDVSKIPKHVAIIMDGNSRWAERRGLPASMGHEAGVRSLKEVVKLANTWGIKVLSVFAFSTENWLRPKAEVDFLMLLFENVLKDELSSLAKENVRVHCMGDLTLLPDSLKNLVSALDERTKNNTGLKFCIALSYSGRNDIANACQRLAAKVEAGELSSSDITETMFEEELKTSWLGEERDPDLLIRTSEEQRISNFLLWQSAYTEFYFVDSLWPDFGVAQFKEALLTYQNRSRRFGKRK
ncbi:uncharacterized protein [Physcomitrium patens]|uniref:Alkyl transferase n=1 Tax=Physcomitrium patens TaxID=3218 RepID=A0A2K1L001_PHYPA|nr:hypothetical protein PHYPA_002140 [Physcomitrium patens]